MVRTDMAVEIFKPDQKGGIHVNFIGGMQGIKRTDVVVDSENKEKYPGRQKGKYITVEVKNMGVRTPDTMQNAAVALSRAVGNIMRLNCPSGGYKNVLIVGLGNRGMTADALGHKVVDKIIVTRHLLGESEKAFGKSFSSVCAFCPNVLGVTGIESFDIVSGIAKNVKPDLIIAVDTLASRSTGRLSSAFQVSDTGIVPGSGVGNHRFELSKKTLGVTVLSVGVPLVVYASTIVKDVLEEAGEKMGIGTGGVGKGIISEVLGDLVVTPKDIDVIVKDCAYIIALALNLAVHNRLSKEDAVMLMETAN